MSSLVIIRNPVSRSFLIHFALLWLVFFYIQHAPKILNQNEPIPIEMVDVGEKAQKKVENKTNKRIVQKSLGKEVAIAKTDSYLSDKTRVTDEERSARTMGEATPKLQNKQHEQAALKATPKTVVSLSDIGMKLSTANPDENYNKDRNWAKSQTGEAVSGGEYIQGMKEGEASALNTKEFIFFSFFERMRKQLDQSWQPLLRSQIQRIYKNGRKLASNTDYVTRTRITLNQKGEIIRVRLDEESGTFDLDQVAIDALNKAGPYPNPPKGLVDSSGTIEVRWDFVLRT